MIGQTLGPYRILARLGAGGMGVVYEAEDTRLGRHVAIKFLPDALSADSESLRRFQREARAASALSHPGICTVYDVGEHEGRPYIVLEHLEGQTLQQQIASRRHTADEILDLGLQITAALEAAHQAGIVHRDIKPANLFVTTQGRAKILDFGLAKRWAGTDHDSTPTGHGQDLTSPGATLGTVAYMSPEQALGRPLDARTDVFSLGVVLYELATGNRPFTGATTAAIFDEILHTQPSSPAVLNPDLPADLAPVIAKALEKVPALRYPSAQALGVDLRRLQRELGQGPLGGRPSSTSGGAQPDSGPGTSGASRPEAASGAGRRWRWRTPLALAALLVVAVAAFSVWRGTRTGPPVLTETDNLLVTDFVNTTGDADFDGSLKTALTVKLSESAYFNIVSEAAVQDALRLMQRPPDESVTPAIGREVCQRLNHKAMLRAEIARIGSRYLLTLQAEDCRTGEVVARAQSEATGKDDVLSALDDVTKAMRGRLGETLASIQKADTPLDRATTSSLEALKAFSRSTRANVLGDFREAAAFAQRAVELDPDFALAHYSVSVNHLNRGDLEASRPAARRAFELRDRVSERERITIDENYYALVTEETDRAIECLELGVKAYPREAEYWNNLGVDYGDVGRYDAAIDRLREALRLNPSALRERQNLSKAYAVIGKLTEARAVLEEAVAAGTASPWTHAMLFRLAFIAGDRDEQEKQKAWLASHPDDPTVLEVLRMAEAARAGRHREFRQLRERARLAAPDARGYRAAVWWHLAGAGGWAAVDALVGHRQLVEREASRALAEPGLFPSANTQAAVALALGRFPDAALKVAEGVTVEYPRATIWNGLFLPLVRANVELTKGQAGVALETLHATEPFAFAPGGGLLSIYTKGQALLALGRGAEAAAEFQRVIDHPGVDTFAVTHPLARLGLARAHAQSGDAGLARTHYEAFFTQWKDADPDLPVLQEARAEFASLK